MRRLQLLPFIIAIMAFTLVNVNTASAQVASLSYQSSSTSKISAKPSVRLADNVPAVGSISVQAGLGYQSHVEKLNLNVGGWYQIIEKIAGGIIFNYFFLDSVPGASQTAWSLDFLGRYPIYMVPDGMTIYAVGGLNYLSWKFTYDEACGVFGFSCDWSVSDVGLDAGGQLILPLGGFNLFANAGIVLGSSGGLSIGAGGALDL